MTVQQLIDKLSVYPKDAQVVVNNDLGQESFNIHSFMARIESVDKFIREFNPENKIKECSPELSNRSYDDYLAEMGDNF